jgi:hypothetical protein
MTVGTPPLRMDRLWYGPLLAMPYTARMHIVKAVAAGQPVPQAAWADPAGHTPTDNSTGAAP